MNAGTLYVVATPIGNLDDLSSRAQAVLGAVDLIAAEDTRVTGRLLSHFGIKCRQISLHDHNEDVQTSRLIGEIESGRDVALVSDAGTPLISDPGYRLVRAAHAAQLRVVPVPGPSALVAALSASGLPTDCFLFAGFLPAKTTARVKRLETLATVPNTLVFFESVHRIKATLEDLVDVFGEDRCAFVGRELTKIHEQCVAARLKDLLLMTSDGRITLKGEFVLVVAGDSAAKGAEESVSASHVLRVLSDALPGKQAVALAARLTGKSRNELYAQMLEMKGVSES